jgi:protease-4
VSFQTASAILRGKWLIDKQWTLAHMPLVLKMMKGEQVDFGLTKEKIEIPREVLSRKAGSVYQVSYYSDLSRLPFGSIAMLDVVGPITKYGDMCSYGSVDNTATMNRLAASQNVAGIILNTDSPGGEASGTAMFADSVDEAKQQKPVIALIDDGIAASAGIWIISKATEIYTSQKTDMVGSVGVYQTIADWYAYFESEGLKVRDVYAPQSIDKNLEYRQALEGNDDLIKAELEVLATEFINTIRGARGDKLTSDEWTTGKMFYSKDAIRIGLIDGQKSMSEVVKRMDTLIKQNKNSNSNNNTYSMKWPNLASLLGKKEVATATETQIEEKHGDDIEATITERDGLKTENTSLKTENDQLKTKVSDHESTIATLNTEKTNLTTENSDLKVKVTTLENADGKAATTIVTEEDKNPVVEVSANDMDFQKELFAKLG